MLPDIGDSRPSAVSNTDSRMPGCHWASKTGPQTVFVTAVTGLLLIANHHFAQQNQRSLPCYHVTGVTKNLIATQRVARKETIDHSPSFGSHRHTRPILAPIAAYPMLPQLLSIQDKP
jgi:hypothetical protein